MDLDIFYREFRELRARVEPLLDEYEEAKDRLRRAEAIAAEHRGDAASRDRLGNGRGPATMPG